MKHKWNPFFSCQFQPEASIGHVDTEFLFENFLKLVNEYKKINTYNFFLQRDETKYETGGRLQNLEESIQIDNRIIDVLNKHQIEFESIKSCPENANVIVEKILKKVASV